MSRGRWSGRGSNPNFQTPSVDPWIRSASNFLCNISLDGEPVECSAPAHKIEEEVVYAPEDEDSTDGMDDTTRGCAADFLMHISQDLQTRRSAVGDSPRIKPLDGAEQRAAYYQEILQRNLHPDQFREQLKQSRCPVLHVTADHKSPVTLSSCIRWVEEAVEEEHDERNSKPLVEEEDEEEGLVQQLLGCVAATKELCCHEDQSAVKKPGKSYQDALEAPDLLEYFNNEDGQLDPFHLDDPELKQSKDRTVLSFSPGHFVVSVLPYLKEKELKDELNEQFMLEHECCHWHPALNKNISLSKIRAAKRKMFDVAQQHNPEIEYSTVALSHLYFELLVLKGIVTKANRYVFAGCCLVLAAKMNNECAETMPTLNALPGGTPSVGAGGQEELEGEDWWQPNRESGADSDSDKEPERPNMRWVSKQRPLEIKSLLADIAAKLMVPAKQILEKEFETFQLLNFGLHVNPKLIDGVFERLLTEERRDKKELSAQAYMSTKSHRQFVEELETFGWQQGEQGEPQLIVREREAIV